MSGLRELYRLNPQPYGSIIIPADSPYALAVGAVVNPFAEDLDRELRLLQRKVAAGATFVQSQMVFDLPRLEAFLARGEDMLAGVRVYASVALLRSERMAERACALPGVTIPEPACAQIRRGGGIELARELALHGAGGRPLQDRGQALARRLVAYASVPHADH